MAADLSGNGGRSAAAMAGDAPVTAEGVIFREGRKKMMARP